MKSFKADNKKEKEYRRVAVDLFSVMVICAVLALTDFIALPRYFSLLFDGGIEGLEWWYLSVVGLVIVVPCAIYVYLRLKKK